MLNMITCCLMQSERDAQRMIELGAHPSRVRCTGNIKFDQPVPQAAGGRVVSKQALGLNERERVVVAGSTHPGEEEMIVGAYQSLCEDFPDLRLVLAPRHIERAGQVVEMVRAKGLAVSRRSTGSAESMSPPGPRVVILDSRGELALLYRDAVVAFVGGTLVPIGGHNLLEPAVWGKPVLFGPYTDHCAEVAALLLNARGGRVVEGAQGLAQSLRELLDNSDALERMGRAAQQVVAENQGALHRSAEIIATFLPPPGTSTGSEGTSHRELSRRRSS
jgi:3-deoxy-D-manno-octulosonic-acid transferase